MPTITTRLSTTADIPLIKKLAHQIWWDHYPSVISNEQIEYMLGRNYTEEALQKQIEEGTTFYLIYDGGEAIGYVAVAASPKEEESYFIHKFYIDTGRHSKGVGTKAFHSVLAAYPNAKSIRLAVNRQNFKSINFYFKNGFKIEKCLDTGIGRGFVMDDFIMLWQRK